ncbi:TonB-dependent receptor [Opitutus sp. ER46]|uniref:TonB-dependent receptor n=1 Tax=Opitutus sp. ER46 TaxID=2161864 RepID=UPI001E4BB172|nr:TonB-dependent receptor [Opitutus sp. ER46]
MAEKKELLTTNRKALTINLDERKYGTFAEIGAGQEVARVFFQAGGASGTVAKTISAYDMTFSDAIYGKAPRYVSRERLTTMLDHEYQLLIERLAEQRGERTAFFVFADTVTTRSFKGGNDAHGWMGIRFQTEPGVEPSDIVLHVRMWDKGAVQQQEALGIAGTNLMYAAFYYRDNPTRFIESLVDNVGTARVEVDMIKFSGPAFAHLDNRLMSLYLVQHGLTNAVMFSSSGDVLQPSEVLYKKAVLVERGSFRPVTHVNVDMLSCATAQFVQEPLVKGKDVMVLMEITMNNLLAAGELDAQDFLSRVDVLGELGFTTMVSNYSEYYRLTSYFRRYTKEMIGVAMGIDNLLEIFNEKYYEHLEGGILESFGRMFRHAVKLYVYPMRQDAYERYLSTGKPTPSAMPNHVFATTVLITARNVQVTDHLRNLYAHLLENHYIACITGFDPQILGIFSRDVLRRLKEGDETWETMVPVSVATAIKQRHLFGYGAGDAPAALPVAAAPAAAGEAPAR